MSTEPLQVGKAYSIDAEFGSYCIEREDQEPIKGYFMKVPSMKSCVIEIDDTDQMRGTVYRREKHISNYIELTHTNNGKHDKSRTQFYLRQT